MKRLIQITAFASLIVFSADAQIFITSLPYADTTDFNSYDPSSTNSNGTLPSGWSANSSSTATFNGRGTGSSQTGGYWAYGILGEYSLGALRTGTPGNITYSVSFTNNSGTTIQSITLSWDYEQWRYANNSGWDISGTGWLANNTILDAKDFTGTGTGTSGMGTSTHVAAFTLTGLNIPNHQSFGIEWTTTDGTGSDNGVAIDNFAISASATTPLPINLLSFSAKRIGTFDRLNWSTSCNSTAKHFSVEASHNGADFRPLIALEARTESCADSRRYEAEVPAQEAALSFYRLAMQDISGQLSYSQTLRVSSLGKPTNVVLKPMPATQHLYIEGVEPGTSWQVLNLQGQTVKRGVFSQSPIDVGELAPGHYFLRHETGAAHFVKE